MIGPATAGSNNNRVACIPKAQNVISLRKNFIPRFFSYLPLFADARSNRYQTEKAVDAPAY